MSLRFHEITEANHRILNPFTDEKLMLLGELCRLQVGMRQLDLACGKAEMLGRWAKQWGIQGVGVDISKVFLTAAQARIKELGVSDSITLIEADAGKYLADWPAANSEADRFDVVSCIGATWIGGGLEGTLKRMRPLVKEGGLLLVGEPYWVELPPVDVQEIFGITEGEFTSLIGTLDRFEANGLNLVEMVLANQDSWDRYEASHWWAFDEWARQNPHDPDLSAFRETTARWKRTHLSYGRRYLGWGVFVLRVS